MKMAENSRRMSKNLANTALGAGFTFAKDEWTPTAAANQMTSKFCLERNIYKTPTGKSATTKSVQDDAKA